MDRRYTLLYICPKDTVDTDLNIGEHKGKLKEDSGTSYTDTGFH